MQLERIVIKVDVKCCRCNSESTLVEQDALYGSDWFRVKLGPVMKSEHGLMSASSGKETCLCRGCATILFPELFPMEMRTSE